MNATKIFLKSSPDTASKVSVWKRYNDFKKLHLDLKAMHGTLEIKESYPPFPKPKFFGRFEAEVIEERRECAVKFLEFIARHVSLYTNDVFVTFFETTLGDNSSADCSLSISSDTSEDDKNTIVENSDKTVNITNQCIGVIRNLPNSGLSVVMIKNNATDNQAVLSVNGTLLDSSISTNLDEQSQIFNNNNVDESEDMNWQQFLSVEKLLENGKNDTLQHCETFATVYDDSDLSNTGQDSSQYILIAAAHMSAGFRHEAIAEYEEAFMQYKLGISNLRHGVLKDPDIVRTTMIKEKITKYSERADRLYNRHLNCNISMISKPVNELRYYKVLRVMGSVMLVNDLHHNITRVIKTVQKPAGVQEDISKYILRGKVPYMVQLHACVQTETTVFLILQYASGGKLWDFLHTRYAIPRGRVSTRKKSYTRSTSCEAEILVNSERRKNASLNRSHTEVAIGDKTEILPSFDAKELLKNAEDRDKNTQDALQRLGEESGAHSMYNKEIPTTKLLEKAEQLLKSVDATIKKSNSIATRLNESGRLLFETEEVNATKETDERDNTEESGDLSDLSTSDSCTDLSMGSDRIHDAVIANKAMFPQLCASELHQNGQSETMRHTVNGSLFEGIASDERLYHDEDSGIDMEQESWRIPDKILKSWAAQMLLTLEALHQQEVVISDLRPDNLLVDGDGQILWTYVVPRQSPELSRYQKPYAAPELCMYLPVIPGTPAADVWSFGVLLYELFTGIPFQSQHPGPFHSHSIISIPNGVSETAKSLLTKILRINPSERLTIPEIKQLPFFEKTDWLNLLTA